MRHNELKTKILKGILDLESFTVSELCAVSGLKRDQVYSELSKLQQEGVITHQTIQSPNSDGKQAAHRPLNLYQLVNDPRKREWVFEQIAPFLNVSIPTQYIETETAKKISRELDKIDLEIEEILNAHQTEFVNSAVMIGVNKMLIKRLRERLASVRDELELAIYESNTLVDPNITPEHPLVIDSKRWRQYSKKLTKLQYQINKSPTQLKRYAVSYKSPKIKVVRTKPITQSIMNFL
jgi:predicted ArsR family transcriptional regulator